MTGPEHYRETERLLVQVDETVAPSEIPTVLAIAQVHATLALAAATALHPAALHPNSPTRSAWQGAAG